MSDASAVPASKGHPPGLYMMFFAELWERFCFYGMRALLAIYVAQLFLVEQSDASIYYGAYASLVYATGIFGGYVADKVLGFRRSILVGGLIMAGGMFTLVVKEQDAFLIGLAMIVVGNGLFKPNISSLVGKLYEEGDPRRDSGFTIFYMGINIGALIAPLLCAGISNMFPIEVALDQLPPGMEIKPEWQEAGVATLADYRWGFGLAGAGMLLGVLTFWFGQHRLGDKGLAPAGTNQRLNMTYVVLGCAVLVPGVYLLIANREVVGYILGGLALAIVGYIVSTALKMFKEGDKVGGQRMFALIILLLANTVFWSCFEQAGNSLNFFARDHVSNPSWFLFEWFQSVNPAYIVMFGSVFAWLWLWLAKKNLNPSIPTKFGLGLVQVGLGFGVCLWAISMAGDDFRTPFVLMFLLYFLHTTGELCLSPVGLSMVTKLAPPRMTGLIMGAWFLSIACANFVAGLLSALAGSIDEDALEAGSIPKDEALAAYGDTYQLIFWYAIGAGCLLLLFSKPINKLMHGIK